MPSKIWINPKCPMYGGDVYFPKKRLEASVSYQVLW